MLPFILNKQIFGWIYLNSSAQKQITFKNNRFNDLWTVDYIFLNPNGRLLVKVNAVRSGFSLFHKYFLITFTKKCL